MTLFRYLDLLIFGSFIALSDVRSRRIPNRMLASFALITVIGYSLAPKELMIACASALVFALILLPLYLLSVRKKGLGMGGGDVKLIVVLALVLGRGDRALGALLLASLIGLVQIIALSIKNRHFLTQIPFGPALIVGSLLAL